MDNFLQGGGIQIAHLLKLLSLPASLFPKAATPATVPTLTSPHVTAHRTRQPYRVRERGTRQYHLHALRYQAESSTLFINNQFCCYLVSETNKTFHIQTLADVLDVMSARCTTSFCCSQWRACEVCCTPQVFSRLNSSTIPVLHPFLARSVASPMLTKS